MNKNIIDIVENMKPLDDTFFHKLIENKEFCEELLRVIV